MLTKKHTIKYKAYCINHDLKLIIIRRIAKAAASVVHPRKSAPVAVPEDEDAAVLWKPQRLLVEHAFLHPHFRKVSHF